MVEDSPYLQAKLKVGPPDVQYERGADGIADQVMRMPEPALQRQVEKEEEEELQMKAESAVLQRQETETEEPLQGKFESVLRQSPEEDEDETLPGRITASETPAQLRGDVRKGANRSGMPGRLKAGLEALSGMDLSGIRVHSNSSKPAQINALAYTQGQDIHMGPGQEKYLPHEGWHAVQQMQGRVTLTMQQKGLPMNDDEDLEREADVMGAKALRMRCADQIDTNPIAQAMTAEPQEKEPTEGTEVSTGATGPSQENERLKSLSTSSHEGTKLIASDLAHAAHQTRSTPMIQRKPDQDGDPVLSRRDEISLSKRTPGEFEIGTGFPPVMSLFNFGINDHQLKKEHKDNLRILGELFGLMGTTQWQVFAIGHADSTGEPAVNDPLSAKRADEVRKYLNNVIKGNYRIQGEGENRPVTTNESVSGRTRNRRVDIAFINPNIDISIPDPRLDPKTVCQLFPSLCNEDEFCDRHPDLCGMGFCAKHPGWCLLPVLCLLFPPACACIATPIVCLCGMNPAFCACLANPLACIEPPEKEDEPEPKRKRACPIKVDLPSGEIEANKEEHIGFARLWYPFEMNIDFSQDSSGCECACGEYTQLVRGYFEQDKTGKGPWKRRKHQLTKGVFLHESTFQEDGTVSDGAYGHRYWDDDTKNQPKSNDTQKNDRFLSTREDGCQYRGKDEPSLESAKKWRARIRMYLEFAGGPADVCESPGQRLGQQAHWRSWIIHGEAQAKGRPTPTSTPPTKSPSTTSPEVTEAEETDIRQGKPSHSWYAGGIPSDATAGEYRMKVGFKVDGVTKVSDVPVKIVASQQDSISVVTINKKNLNLNPGDDKTPIIVEPNHRETIPRSTLRKVEK